MTQQVTVESCLVYKARFKMKQQSYSYYVSFYGESAPSI